MALSKSVDTVDAWSAVAQNAILEGAIKDLTACYQVTLHIDAALTSETASTNGLKIVVQVSSSASGDTNWSELTSFNVLNNVTASLESCQNTLVAGNNVISLSSMSGYTIEGSMFYIDDGASAELYMVGSQSATGLSTLESIAYGHASGVAMYNKTASITVNIPDTANRVRVLYDNTQDASGSTVDVRCNLSKITGI